MAGVSNSAAVPDVYEIHIYMDFTVIYGMAVAVDVNQSILVPP